MKKLRTAVIGAGKMGALHSRIYSQMDDVELVGIADVQVEKAEALAEKYSTRTYGDAAELLGQVDAVTISAPTDAHARVAGPFLTAGIAVLVEKPLAQSLEEAKKLLALAKKHGALLQVGYSERFNPVVQAMHRLKITPRFVEANRISPYTFRSTDVGVVLDIMIHDIDIVLSLVHSPVKDIQAAGVNVIGRHEDIANVRLGFANGCVANLTASRLALKTERKVRVFSEQAYLSLDYLKKTGVMITKSANIDTVQLLRQMHQNGDTADFQNMDWTELLNVENLDIDDREPLRLEQEAFVKAVREGSRPQVSADDAVAAMELAERIVTAIGQHHWEGDPVAAITTPQEG
jgi:predicted dehydrogenase